MPYPVLHNEAALLLEVASGNEQAFATVFNHYRPNIYTTVFRMLGDAQAAEEIVLDVFLKLWLKRDTLPGIENFPGWLRTVTEHLTYNELRREQRQERRSLEFSRLPLEEFSHDAAQTLTEKEYREILEQAIRRLPPRQRQTYILIKQQGMKRDEVAKIMQISPETVKWNLEQATRSIRAYCLGYLKLSAFMITLLCA